MSIPFPLQKELRRKKLRERAVGRTERERLEQSAKICERVKGLPEWKSARAVLAFSPLSDEPDVRPLLALALSEGKELALPRYEKSTQTYLPVGVVDLDRDLMPGRYGILEPTPFCPAASILNLDFALIPGVGFDTVCGRLGRGRGFYDRLLEALDGFKCGVAFTWQLEEDALPVEPHDVVMDLVITSEAGCPKRTGTA